MQEARRDVRLDELMYVQSVARDAEADYETQRKNLEFLH